jgi:hypothetical protein
MILPLHYVVGLSSHFITGMIDPSPVLRQHNVALLHTPPALNRPASFQEGPPGR